MEDNKEVKKNNTKRHTWIGDADEIRNADIVTTRIVEKQKRPYSGFITDKEIEESNELIKIDDRRTRIVERIADAPDMKQTRVYQGFGAEEKAADAEPKKRKSRAIKITDANKFKRLIALLAVFAFLIAFELSFMLMKYSTARLPGKTEKAKAQTAELQEENKTLKEESAAYGEYQDVKELKESWERLRDRLAESE